MNLLVESDIKIEGPFFSVCIETNDRGKTIFRALESLLNQEISNFECIVVDDLSSDDTVAEINRFLSSTEFKKSPYALKVYQNTTHLGGVLNWNSPLIVAKGLYIAGLEGDDYYQAGYLKKAYDKLVSNPHIGIYATGSQRATRPITGLIDSKTYFKYLFQIINIPPPSELIFVRLSKNKTPFKFDTVNNTYAPELQLLMTVSEDGWDAFHSADRDVFREPSTSLTNMTWKYFRDKFEIIDKYRFHPLIEKKEFKESFKRQIILSVRRYLVSDFQKKGDAEGLKNGITKMLKSRNYPGIHAYIFLFNTIVFFNKIKLFALYFTIKKQISFLQ